MSRPVQFEEVRDAFDRQEFQLVYQPIVSLQEQGCLGAEALLRWQRPNGQVVAAQDFMPVVERTPLSGLITYWVIDTVAEQMKAWLEVNPQGVIAINIPPEVLGRGGLEYAARKSGLRSSASQLIFEITERGIPDQLGLDALNLAPSTGVRVALDDVTFSGANVALLMRFHFDYVKIDGRLAGEITDPDAQPAWLRTLSSMLGEAPLQVIVEGIETETQAEVLKQAGVPWGQGFYFSHPLSAVDFQSFYASRSTDWRH